MKKTIYSFSIMILILYFNLTPIKCENFPYSQIKIYIENRTLKFNSPVDIWFNDSLVISQVKYGNSIAAYNLYSKGNLRITTQIRGFENTRCEYALNVLNDQNYNIVIKFDNANKPGSIFGFKKADGKNFEPYFEENLFHRINIDEDSIFTDKGLNEIIIPHEYSVCHLIFLTFGHELIKIWINDQLILNPYVYSLSTINCKFFTEGKIIIAAQLGDQRVTKTQLKFEISNKQSYFLQIKFLNSNDAGTITLLDREEGSELLADYQARISKARISPIQLQRWSATGIRHFDLFTQVESSANPIPSMFYPDEYRASHEPEIDAERVSLRDNNYFEDNRDGQIYKTVKIGDQVWMAENLRATRYRNGDTIPCLADFKLWSDDTLGAYCNPNNYGENAAKYGRLYNYYAANDPRGLAPEGWHIATKEDWSNLSRNLCCRYSAPGLYMQEIDTIFWSREMQNIDDASWAKLKIEIRQVGLEEYYNKVDTVLSIYQRKNNQEIDPGFWGDLRQFRTQTNVYDIRNKLLNLIGEYSKAKNTGSPTDLNTKELENALVILDQLRYDIDQTYQKKKEIEFLPNVCTEFYKKIDAITFIYQKKKKTEMYKMKWEYIIHFPTDAMIPPASTIGISIPNDQKKVEQKSYVISWKDTNQKNDTIYWNKDVQKQDIIAWYYVKYAANSSGFNALPVGWRGSTGEFSEVAMAAYWLSTKADKPNFVGYYTLCHNCFYLNNDMVAFKRKSYGYSLRCVKD